MKKLLIGLLIILLIVLLVKLVLNGMNISTFSVLGYKGVQAENERLESKLAEASKLTSVDYPAQLSELEKAGKTLSQKKEEYEDKVAYSSEEQIRIATQIKQYKLEFVYIKLGQYALKEGVHLDLTFEPTTEDLWNIHFNVEGQYVPITEYLRDIENDDELNFRIDSFKLAPGATTEKLKADFYVKNIGLTEINSGISNDNIVIVNKETRDNFSNSTSSETKSNVQGTQNTTNTNNTSNTTNTNSTTTTNSANTTNTVQSNPG